MGLAQGAADALNDRYDIGNVHVPPQQPIAQRLTCDDGHHNVDVVVVVVPAGVEDANGVGVGEPLESLNLARRPAGLPRILLEVHHLDRDITPRDEVTAAPDGRLAAGAQSVLETVASADRRPGSHRWIPTSVFRWIRGGVDRRRRLISLRL